MEKWHAAKPGSIVAGKAAQPSATKPPLTRGEMSEGARPPEPAIAKPPPQYTAVFGDALVVEAKRDRRVIGITAAMAGGTGLTALGEGGARAVLRRRDRRAGRGPVRRRARDPGAKPVCAIYSTFLQRAYDQLVHDVCLQKLNVVFAMDRAGLVGDDGPTHHGAFDVSYFRALPNVVVMAPRDEAMLCHMLRTALAHDDGPIAFRYPRGAAEGVPLPDRAREIPIGTGEVLKEGERVALVGYGYGVRVALDAAALLAEHDLTVTVADARFAKPLDERLLERLAAEHELGGDDRGERARRRLRLRGARAPRGRVRRFRGRAGAGDARRPAGSLRHPRQAGHAP